MKSLKRGVGYTPAEKQAIWAAYQRQIAEFGRPNWTALARELKHERQAIRRAVEKMLQAPPETTLPASVSAPVGPQGVWDALIEFAINPHIKNSIYVPCEKDNLRKERLISLLLSWLS